MNDTTAQPSMSPFSAVVLAGGQGTRLGGVDKASVEIDGRTMLVHALDAVIDAAEVCVVGDPVPTERPVTFTVENPRHGGPAAGLLAGLDALVHPSSTIAVLAVDMPRLTTDTFRRLLEAAAANGVDGAVLCGVDGRRQLAMVLDRARLESCRPSLEDRHNLPLHVLLAPLHLVTIPGADDEHRDVDTWTDLRDLSEV